MTAMPAPPVAGHAAERGASRLELLLRTVLGGAALLVGGALVEALGHPVPDAWRILTVAGLLAVGNAPLLRLRFGAHGSSYTYGEAAVVLALPLLPPSWLLIVAAVAALLIQAVDRLPIRKVAFNVANFSLGVAAAVSITSLIAPVYPDGIRWGRPVVAVLVGMAAFALLQNTAVAAAVAFAQHVPLGAVIRRGLGVTAFVAVINTVLGVGVSLLATWEWQALMLMPAFIVTVAGTYRGYLAAATARDTWQRLELAGKDLKRLDELPLVGAVLQHSLTLFLADWVELSLHATGPLPARHYRREAGGLGRAPGGPALAGHASVVSLRGGTTELGTLTIGFREPVKFSPRETQVLTNFGNSVSLAVANSQLYAELRIEAERRAFEATHDQLTGLANRRRILDEASVAGAGLPPGHVCALLLFDLDHFREINDTLGHIAGDHLLRRLGDRLKVAVGARGTVGLLASSEFAVLLPSTPLGQVEMLARELQGMLAEPVPVAGVRIAVEASVGASCMPTDASGADELLQHSAVALQLARELAGSYRRYCTEDDSTSPGRLALGAELRAALDHDELVVYFQPQLDLETGHISGAEALIRWQHPTRGLLPPADFIPTVEQSGLVRPVTLRVLDLAVSQAATWRAQRTPLQVAVNLSARTLLDRQLPEDVDRILRRHGVPPDSLILEITETMVVSELEIVENVLSRLRILGVELAVDDFGTGYSSLALLQRIAVNEIKADRSFVHGMLCSDSDAAIIRATIELAHSLGLRVVAEGVESADLLMALRRLGCDRVQGFHIGKAVPAADMPIGLRIAPATRVVHLHESALRG